MADGEEAMHDLVPHGKTLFWVFLVGFVALAAVPSVILVETAEQYYHFLAGWDPGVLRERQVSQVPHALPIDANSQAKIRFVDFHLKAPKAKSVRLAGDFNHWRPELSPLSAKHRGQWEIQIPLPPGTYQYLFQVDGIWTRDPTSQSAGEWAGRPTSIREVH